MQSREMTMTTTSRQNVLRSLTVLLTVSIVILVNLPSSDTTPLAAHNQRHKRTAADQRLAELEALMTLVNNRPSVAHGMIDPLFYGKRMQRSGVAAASDDVVEPLGSDRSSVRDDDDDSDAAVAAAAVADAEEDEDAARRRELLFDIIGNVQPHRQQQQQPMPDATGVRLSSTRGRRVE